MENKVMQQIIEDLFALMPMLKRNLVKAETNQIERDMSPSHLYVIFLLEDLGTLSMLEIGRHCNIAKSNLTPLVQRLIDKGLVERIRDEQDRRIIRIALTELGAEFLEQHKSLMAEVLKEKMTVLSEQDLQRLSNSLNETRELLSKLK